MMLRALPERDDVDTLQNKGIDITEDYMDAITRELEVHIKRT